MVIGGREFNVDHKCYIMGILNVTPDSFSDGGKWDSLDRALHRTEIMIREGMDILDIGGESTRPGHTVISDQEEIERVVPFVEAVRMRFDIPISVDTYKSRVADAAIKAGAALINDIWGLRKDSKMAGIIAQNNVACCLMHNREHMDYRDFFSDVLEDLRHSVSIAKSAGVENHKIILDPGVGFAKNYKQNLQVINGVDRLKVIGCPILLGTSRKSVIGTALNLPVDERLEGTLATTVIAVLRGCSFVRVHDVKENKRAVIMTEALRHSNPNE